MAFENLINRATQQLARAMFEQMTWLPAKAGGSVDTVRATVERNIEVMTAEGNVTTISRAISLLKAEVTAERGDAVRDSAGNVYRLAHLVEDDGHTQLWSVS